MARRKKRAAKFLKRGNDFIYLTGESPKGFGDALHVAWVGMPPKESIEPSECLKDAIEVDADDVPVDFYEALVDEGVCEPREEVIYVDDCDEPEPEPEPPRRRKSKRTEEDRYEEWQHHVAGGLDMVTACAASGFLLDDDEPEPKPRPVSEPATAREFMEFMKWAAIFAVVVGILMNLGNLVGM